MTDVLSPPAGLTGFSGPHDPTFIRFLQLKYQSDSEWDREQVITQVAHGFFSHIPGMPMGNLVPHLDPGQEAWMTLPFLTDRGVVVLVFPRATDGSGYGPIQVYLRGEVDPVELSEFLHQFQTRVLDALEDDWDPRAREHPRWVRFLELTVGAVIIGLLLFAIAGSRARLGLPLPLK